MIANVPPETTGQSYPPPTRTIHRVGLSLRRNFAWTFAGNVIYAACQWAVLVVIAKLTTPADVGQFALGLAVTAPILIFANQGLRDVQATDAKRSFVFRQYLPYRLASVTLALLIVAGLTYAFDYPAVVMVVGISKALESWSDLVYGRFQQEDRMDWIATSMMLRGVLAVVAVTVLLRITHMIEWGVAGLVVSNAVVLVLYDWRNPRWLLRRNELPHLPSPVTAVKHKSSTATIVRITMLGLPLGLAQMLNSFSTNIPRYFLERHVGQAGLGIFAAIMYLLFAGRTVIAALAQSCVARLARLYADHEFHAFRSLLFKQIALALVFGAGGLIVSLLWGKFLLRVIYRADYAEYTGVLLLAMGIAAINYLAEFTGTALTAVRRVSIQPVILGMCVVVGWVSCTILVPRYGINGACWATLLTGAFQLSAYTCVLVYTMYRTDSARAASNAV